MADKKTKTHRKRASSPFAENLKNIIAERNLSVRAVAELAGVAASMVSSWTKGTLPYDLLAIKRLATALGVNFEWLTTGEISTVDMKSLSLDQLFQEEKAFSGIYKTEATRLIRRGSEDE